MRKGEVREEKISIKREERKSSWKGREKILSEKRGKNSEREERNPERMKGLKEEQIVIVIDKINNLFLSFSLTLSFLPSLFLLSLFLSFSLPFSLSLPLFLTCIAGQYEKRYAYDSDKKKEEEIPSKNGAKKKGKKKGKKKKRKKKKKEVRRMSCQDI